MLYEISQLKQIYGSRTVLDIHLLEIQAGGVYALLGPNGAGKTTLLKILAFLETPSQGTIRYGAETVHFTESRLQLLRKTVVLAEQNPILFTASVFKNLEFGLKVRKVPKPNRQAIIEGALDLVGMRAFIHAPAHRLSGGETQRVALARALVVSPRVLLCDEPTASVDAEHQAAIVRILRNINLEKKITVILSTHDRFHAQTLAHHTLYLNEGILTGESEENIFRAESGILQDGSVLLTVGGVLRLPLPSDRIPSAGPLRIAIDSEKILLVKDGSGIFATVRQVGDAKDKIRAVVDAGLPIVLMLSRKTYRDQAPMVGDRVGLAFPPESIRVL